MGEDNIPGGETAAERPAENTKKTIFTKLGESWKNRKRPFKVAVGVILILIVLGGVGSLFVLRKSINNQEQTPEQKELSALTEARKKALLAAGHKDITKAEDEAQEQQILLAALKSEADKRNVAYTEVEIDAFLKADFDAKGGKDGYLAYMQAVYQWSREDVYLYKTIEYLKSKLGGELLSTRTYSMTFIRWDAFKGVGTEEYNRMYAEREKKLTDDHLPLYQQKADKKQLASKAELREDMSTEQQENVYASRQGAPIIYNYISHGPDNPSSDYQKYPEGEDMHTKLISLQSVGDFTGPFKSNSGILAIIKLEKSEGGEYFTWDDFAERYKDQKGLSLQQSDPNTFNKVWSVFSDVLAFVIKPFSPQKVNANENCTVSHALRYVINYVDHNTGALLPAADLSIFASTRRNTGNCSKTAYNNAGYATGPTASSGGYDVSKTFYDNNAGSITVVLDCNGPAWNISNTTTGTDVNIPGYTRVQIVWPAGYNNSFPYFSGANGSGTFTTTVRYQQNSQPFTVQGVRVIGSPGNIIGTIPNGAGNTDINGFVTSSNPFSRGGHTSNIYVTASATISSNGKTYERLGSTRCYNDTTCHGGGNNGYSTNATRNFANQNGGYIDNYWYYRELDQPPSFSSSANCSSITINNPSDVNGSGGIRVIIRIDNNVVYDQTISQGGTHTFAYPTAYKDTNGHNVSIEAFTILPPGGSNAGNTNRSHYVGACDQAPNLTLNADCNTISGSANDPDSPGAVNVTITVGSFTTTVSANPNFSIPYPTSEQDNNGRTVVAVADGRTPGGSNSGFDTTRSRFVSACYAASCTASSVNGGQPVTATLGFNTSASFRNTGQLAWPNGRITSSSTFNGVTSSPAVPNTNSGGTATMTYGTFATPANLNNRTVTMRLVLDGNQTLATCSQSFDPYTDFVLNPVGESLDLSPDQENPDNAIFTSRVDVTYVQVPGENVGINGPRATRVITKNGSPIFTDNNFTGAYVRTPVTRFPDSTPVPNPKVLGDNYCGTISLDRTTGKVNRNGNVINLGGGAGPTGPQCEDIANRPYLRIYGGDVTAGAGFATINASGNEDCTPNPNAANARHIGFIRVNGPSHNGSGVQLAAYAVNQNEEFASTMLRTASPAAPRGLSFANTSGTYGGFLGSTNITCIPDFFSSRPDSTPALSGTVTRNAAPAFPPNREVTEYIDGNLILSGNISYPSTVYNSRGEIFSYRVIVRGNIYVQPNVSRLDGIYIAQPRDDNGDNVPDAGTGRFYTCASGAAPPSSSQIINACRTNKLTVNGSVVAQLIKPYRTNGTLRDAPNFEPRGSGNIAEEILFTPEVWLQTGLPTGRAYEVGEYDAYSNLSPVL